LWAVSEPWGNAPDWQPAAELNMQTPSPRILIADDQADVLEALRLLLKGEGLQ
jgi:hypothetical protein